MSEYIIESNLTPGYDRNGEKLEEIVRCRDCKYCMAYTAAAYCDYLSHAVDAELNGFCAWGERRDA